MHRAVSRVAEKLNFQSGPAINRAMKKPSKSDAAAMMTAFAVNTLTVFFDRSFSLLLVTVRTR
jgi:hypothetical protein